MTCSSVPVLWRDLLLRDPEQYGNDPVLLEQPAGQLGRVLQDPAEQQRREDDQLQPGIVDFSLVGNTCFNFNITYLVQPWLDRSGSFILLLRNIT